MSREELLKALAPYWEKVREACRACGHSIEYPNHDMSTLLEKLSTEQLALMYERSLKVNWQCEIDISDEFKRYDEGNIEINVLAQNLAVKIMKCDRYNLADSAPLHDIVEKLPHVYAMDDFEELLEQLTDYGEINRRLWVKTVE